MPSDRHVNRAIHVSGAGPSGLAAAITIAKRGGRVIVHERNADVGGRFHGDLQGIENWTTTRDALEELVGIGIEPSFSNTPYREMLIFGPEGQEYLFRSPTPFFYLVRRGATTATLDASLKVQALKAGVEIRFGDPGNFLVPRTARREELLFVGEAAGFQDALWGFGMRYAMLSGHLAAQVLLEGRAREYDSLWKRRMGGFLRASIVNRYVYGKLGDSGCSWLFGLMGRNGGGYSGLQTGYALSFWKRMLYPMASRAVRTSRKEAACAMEDCDCTWCRCQHALDPA